MENDGTRQGFTAIQAKEHLSASLLLHDGMMLHQSLVLAGPRPRKGVPLEEGK